ncbi:uncharacterized protein LOC142925526 [Petromyzon marinus]|uniref:uncharacterized protein LOC142925526 n=1 Tax=Petromyzon marinus TaxID=7757 RepID=UPI003F72C3E9
MAAVPQCLSLLPALLGVLSLLAWGSALLSSSWGLTTTTATASFTGPSGAPGPKVQLRLGLFSAWRKEEGRKETRVDIKRASVVLFAMGRVAVTGAAVSAAAVALTVFTTLASPPCLETSHSLTLQLLALSLMFAAWLGAVCSLLLLGGPRVLRFPVSVAAGALALGGLAAFTLWRLASIGGGAAEEEDEEGPAERERLMEDDIETEFD